MSDYDFRSTRLDDLAVGTRIRVTAYGLGARLLDCGRTGTVIKVNRVRVVVDLEGAWPPDRFRTVHPSSLRVIDGSVS